MCAPSSRLDRAFGVGDIGGGRAVERDRPASERVRHIRFVVAAAAVSAGEPLGDLGVHVSLTSSDI